MTMNTDPDDALWRDSDAYLQEQLRMRRKALKRLLGYLLLPVGIPLVAVTAEIARPDTVGDMADDVRNWFKVWHRLPRGDAKKDAVIDDFLDRIKAVIDHDDLADRDFIAETLGGAFVLDKEIPGHSPDEVILDYHLIKPSLPSLQMRNERRKHLYRAYVSRSTSDTSEAYLHLEVEFDGPHTITASHIRKAFGTPRISKASDHFSSIFFYQYRWRGDNFIVAAFGFGGDDQSLWQIKLHQNSKHYMSLKW